MTERTPGRAKDVSKPLLSFNYALIKYPSDYNIPKLLKYMYT